VGRTEKVCASKEAYKPDSVTPAVRRIPTKFTQLCGKLVEGYPKRLTQVKQFKGNATKY
jgi:hypothetical protein